MNCALDAEDAIRRMGGNRSLYLRLLGRFRDTYPDAIAELRMILTDQGVDAAEAFCHGLKGVCGNIGARALHAALQDVDETLRASRPPDPATLDTLGHLLQDVLEAIDSATGEDWNATDKATA